MKGIKKFIFLFLAILFLIGILFLSSQEGAESSKLSSKVTQLIIKLFIPNFNDAADLEGYNNIHIKIRKLAHFGEYFIFSILIFLAINKLISIKWGLVLMLPIYLILATLDELFQSYIPGRSGSYRDVLVDFSGALAGFVLIIIVLLIMHFVHKRKGDFNAD